MLFETRRALVSASILVSIALAVSACASAPLIVTTPTACSSLVGPSLRADVEGVDLPPLDADAGEVWVALDGQTGRLDTSNRNKTAVLEVVERCEARDAAALTKRTLWQRLTPWRE